ncbi:MAPEG family-domain-containing protein [Plectosphaerella plurivora]|uniref:MAPEG family-domain-containing protein n=1 Tax=Plectosphaerella plurivora TaxID=936078 RepID=A0A9P8V1J4_9PEZI|nr:MAPEG family-domain-containing protein [Plectosphaerella plurivora]
MSGFLGLDFTQKGLALYTIPATWLLSLLPHAYSGLASGDNLDPAYPRTLTENLGRDQKMDKRKKQRIIRAVAAEANTVETLGVVAGAVVAATAAGADPQLTNLLSFGILAVRAAYIYVYVVLQEDRNMAPVRSIIWTVNMLGVISLYIIAARALAAA